MNNPPSTVVKSNEIQRAIKRAGMQLGYDIIKELQIKVMQEVVTGHDVFAVLPTGFG